MGRCLRRTSEQIEGQHEEAGSRHDHELLLLLELELLLLPFARERLTEISSELLRDYERLLECEDLDIYDWLQARSQPGDRSLQRVVSEVREFQASRGARRAEF